MQTTSGWPRGTTSSNSSQAFSSGNKQKASKKSPTNFSNGTTSSGQQVVAVSANTPTPAEEASVAGVVETESGSIGSSEGGTKSSFASGSSHERNRLHHNRGTNNYAQNTGTRRNFRDQGRGNNHGWHQRSFGINSNGVKDMGAPGVQQRGGPRNYNRNMYINNTTPGFINAAGLPHDP